MIVDVSGTDTLKIQKFDDRGRLVFWKSFPQYGASQILTYTYSDNRLTNYTWTHSKYGFIISEYIYDTISNIRTTYSYEPEDEDKDNSIGNLMSFHNEGDLSNSKQYQDMHQNKNKFLKEIAFYRDTFLIKEIQFNREGDTTQVTTYTYDNNLLKDQKLILKHNNAFNDIVYRYDANGNEIEWMKIFDGTDTAYAFKKKYLDNKIVEEQEFEGKSLQATTKYEYTNGLLTYEKDYDASGNLKRQKQYYYNANNTLSKIIDYDRTIYYFYE